MLKLLKGMLSQKQEQRDAELYRNLLRHEAKIGGELFGPVKNGGRREFFCLDEHTWVWHEEWIDDQGQRRTMMTRYDVRPNGIVKVQNGTYSQIDTNEAVHFYDAIATYFDRVNREIYSTIA